MKFSLIVTERIVRHSVVFSPRRRQIDSRATFTTAGGFAIERTSTRCCFFMDLTATEFQKGEMKRTISRLYTVFDGNELQDANVTGL